ncbi:MAG: glycosyltransferase [bacterium]
MKIAIVHEWLTAIGGAERCLKVFSELWPEAPIFVPVYNEKVFGEWFPRERVRTSFLQKWPNALNLYRNYLPFMPSAAESYDLSEFDVVLSSSHCTAGGCKPRKDAIHISYCYTPMRYVWDLKDTYASRMDSITRAAFLSQVPWLRKWDVNRSKRVTHFIPISETIRERIKRIYNRDGKVIYPPVRDKFFKPVDPALKEDYYLILSRLVGYKRLDIAVEACAKMNRRLIVAGSGRDFQRLAEIAGEKTEFLGFVDENSIVDLTAKAKALLHPSLEDFGIVPCEAACAGTPTIAYGVGGASETVIDGITGILFNEQTTESMINAIEKFESLKFETSKLVEQGRKFGEDRFRIEIKNAVEI